MTMKAFIIVFVTVAGLVTAAVYMHRPRSGAATAGFSLHGALHGTPQNR